MRHPDRTGRQPVADDEAAPTRSTWFVVLGAGQVVLGGLVAAIAAPLELDHGSWLAAYLVLVGGVAQYVLGRAPGWFGDRPGENSIMAQILLWNAGNAAVLAGTLFGIVYLVDAGSIALVLVLLSRMNSTLHRSTTPVPARHTPTIRGASPTLLRVVYMAALIALTVSVPVGLVLAHLRAS